MRVKTLNTYLRHKAFERKHRKSTEKRKQLRIRRSCRKKSNLSQKSSKNPYRFKYTQYQTTISGDFALLSNSEYVIDTINTLTSIKNSPSIRYIIHIDISEVTLIDIGAIGLLLSAINSLSRRNIHVFGNYPKDDRCKQIFISSGFLDHMRNMQGKPFKKDSCSNLLIERGFDRTNNKRIGEEIRHSVSYLTGDEKSYRPVFSMAQEMIANAIEHANRHRQYKNWLFAVYYEKDKVIFTITDIGEGILSTLRKKTQQKIADTVTMKDDMEVLMGAFDKKYQSSTLDPNRNKGLPRIKEINENEYVENLQVVTNRVYLDFSTPNHSRKLTSNFKGTFYYWELTKKAIQRWEQRNL